MENILIYPHVRCAVTSRIKTYGRRSSLAISISTTHTHLLTHTRSAHKKLDKCHPFCLQSQPINVRNSCGLVCVPPLFITTLLQFLFFISLASSPVLVCLLRHFILTSLLFSHSPDLTFVLSFFLSFSSLCSAVVLLLWPPFI